MVTFCSFSFHQLSACFEAVHCVIKYVLIEPSLKKSEPLKFCKKLAITEQWFWQRGLLFNYLLIVDEKFDVS